MQILELRLMTHCLAAQQAFYADALRLPLLDSAPDSFSVQAANTRLTFEQAEPATTPAYHFAFNIPENGLASAKAWLSQRTALLPIQGKDEIFFEDWNAHACYFHDPAGNVVEFIARHNLPNGSADPFGPGDIIEVSEIGLPVNDVLAMVGWLEAEIGLTPWRAPSEAFTPVGDEHGLALVVQRGRPWLSTDLPAAIYPTRLTIGGTPARYSAPGLPYHISVVSR